MAQPPETFFAVAWGDVRTGLLAELGDPAAGPAREVAMRHLFAWDPETRRAEAAGEVPRDLLRLYYHLLVENERLPEDAQLSLPDLGLVRATLLATRQGRPALQRMVDRMFRLVQEKVEAAAVSQAWLMLQLFDYDRGVRLWNERNLYLEEMTLRFGEQERTAAPGVLLPAVAAADLAAAGRALEDLPRRVGVQLLLLGTDTRAREEWQRLVPPGDGDGPFDPAELRKWRPAARLLAAEPGELLAGTRSPEALRHHLVAHLKSAYFLLLVANPTGWEPYLPRLYEWVYTRTEGRGATLLSELHRRVTMEEASVREALDALYAEHLEALVGAEAQAWTGGAVAEVLLGVLGDLGRAGAVKPGRYALTGLVLDRLLGVTYPRPELAWLVHRLL